jgi:hypothetical protein
VVIDDPRIQTVEAYALVLLIMTPCHSLVDGYQCLLDIMPPILGWIEYVPQKNQYPSARLHRVISQKTTV